MPHAYTEDQLVEQLAIGLFAELGWATASAALDKLTRDRSSMLLEQSNREVYGLINDGIKFSVPDRDNGGRKLSPAA